MELGNTVQFNSLKWVKEELRLLINDIQRHMESYVSSEQKDEAHLAEIVAILRQVRGTLSLIEIHGAALLCEEMELLVKGLQAGSIANQDSAVDVLMDAVIRLLSYLDSLIMGEKDAPLLLLPLLNDLRACRNEQLLSENVLFFPDVKQDTGAYKLPGSRKKRGPEEVCELAKKIRYSFQLGLLGWFRDKEREASLGKMKAVLARLLDNSKLEKTKRLWWLSVTAVEALELEAIESSVAIKSIMGQVDRQIKQLSDQKEEPFDKAISQELIRNLLYYIARSEPLSELIKNAQIQFNLSSFLPPAGEATAAEGGLAAGSNQELLEAVKLAIHEDVTQAKDILDIFVLGDRSDVSSLEPLKIILLKIADTLAMLGLGHTRQSIKRQLDTLQGILDGAAEPDQDVLMSIASVLLDVESDLEAYSIKRSPSDSGDVDEDVANQLRTAAETQKVMGALINEALRNLARVKDAFLDYMDNPNESGYVSNLNSVLSELEGAMSVASMEGVVPVLVKLQQYFEKIIQNQHIPAADEQDKVADVVTNIECYLEAVAEGRIDAELFMEASQVAIRNLDQASSAQNDSADQSLEEIEMDLSSLADDLKPDDALSIADETAESITLGEVPEAEPSVKTVLQNVRPPATDPKDYESLQVIGDDSDEEILDIFIEEALEELGRISELFPVWKDSPKNSDAITTIRRSFHTLKGSGRLVGAALIGEFAWCLENMFNRLIEGTIDVSPDVYNVVEEAIAVLPQLIEQITGNRQPIDNVFDLMRRADRLATHQYSGEEVPASVKESESTAGEASLEEDELVITELPSDDDGELNDVSGIEEIPLVSIEESLETDAEDTSSSELNSPDNTNTVAIQPQSVDPVLLEIFTEESKTHLATIDQFIADAKRSATGIIGTPALTRALHTLHGSAKTAKFQLIAAVADYLERYANQLQVIDLHWQQAELMYLEEGVHYIRNCLDHLVDHTSELIDEERLLSKLKAKIKETQVHVDAFESQLQSEPTTIVDEPDPELVEVFLEEGQDLIESMENELQHWIQSNHKQEHIENMMRSLHTMKGSARMAGLSDIGDLCHAVESLFIAFMSGGIEPNTDCESVLHDAMDQLVELLDKIGMGKSPTISSNIIDRLNNARQGEFTAQSSSTDTSPEESAATVSSVESQEVEMRPIPVTNKPAQATDSFSMHAVQTEDETAVPAPAFQQEQVRVRADKLDNLVNYAGEVNIYHARVAQHMNDFNFNLGEVGQTVDRLKGQLREMEIQTEAQIASRHEREIENPNVDFDPLEMDRYSHMQQLSRSLAESANDLENLKDYLSDLTRDSEALLLQQSRISTDLQDGLLQTRMVRFEGIGARLRRVVRQTAQQTSKKVDLQLQGLDTEVDRGIQEKILAPLEHILRNAVFHGIETPAKRAVANKMETGHIQLSVGRDGSYIVINVMDDGQGVNLKAVKKKAIEKGLMTASDQVSDLDIIRFILHKGFSTAEDVSQIAGRGVGMDVVDSEIKQLGGSLSINSKEGRGTLFSIRLPLTLAINQALLVSAGSEVYAIPLTDIEGVARITGKELEKNIKGNLHDYEYAGQVYSMSYLGALLAGTAPEHINPDGLYPLLMLRIADRYLAISVEEMLGRREVVVKPVGPQISSLPGISGATILADGHVALILDVASLFQEGEVTTAVQTPIVVTHETEKKGSDELTVMIVDDSITIRKVTARILGRHRLNIMTAKDGVDAITQLQDQVPDLFLMDIEMPRMDGFELATHVRADTRLKNIPIIMITSRTGEKHRERAAKIGVDRYLGKPFQENDLMKDINELLQRTE